MTNEVLQLIENKLREANGFSDSSIYLELKHYKKIVKEALVLIDNQTCFNCGELAETNIAFKYQSCCSGFECGCMGLPEPLFCNKCEAEGCK